MYFNGAIHFYVNLCEYALYHNPQYTIILASLQICCFSENVF
ncbi:hypothetical protein RUMCAL_00799 [Ruminococcus callidus ATCC 27760]|uniref:Uncharacterized protein n=1 Tax=Ruminococcus callidus ATCC 27760 TaxID=411473 RepID=U2KX53_9FIRM|nr:hypothetical protein RUMCAL_00799 [Ruminococcus callidus ATCC 27760]